MKSRITSLRFVAVSLLAMLVFSCANQKEPAQQALSAAETAVQGISADAQKYVPDQFADLSSSLASLKASFEKNDFKAVIAGAPAVMSKVQSVGAAAAAKKDELMASLKGDWTKLAADIPQMVSAIQSRVDILSSSKKLPANLTADAVASAKSGLDSMKQMWADATAAGAKGDVESAVNTAKSVQAKGNEVLKLLGMSAE